MSGARSCVLSDAAGVYALTDSALQQIAAFVVPLLVIVGWITHHDLTLFFADFEVRLLTGSVNSTGADVYIQTIVLFVSVLLVNFLIQYVILSLCIRTVAYLVSQGR